MKKAVVLLLSVVVLIVLLFGATTPTAKGLTNCMDTYTSKMKDVINVANEEKMETEQICKEAVGPVSEFVVCYEEVVESSLVPYGLIKVLSPKTVLAYEDTVNLHNSNCTQYPVTPKIGN